MTAILLVYNKINTSKITFTRFLYENKLHFPCIQYVTAKVAYSAEIAKHPALSGAVAVIKSAKLLQKSEMRKDIVIELSYKGFG